MYTYENFKSKKEFKEAVKAGVKVRVYQPNDFFGQTEKVQQGEHVVSVEGPHYPKPHKWYARVVVKDGVVVKVE
jgi:hypothetical protein